MTIYAGAAGFVGQTTRTVHSGKGAIIALVVSHAESTPQTVTLWDSLAASGAVLLRLQVQPEASPAYIRFPTSYPLRYITGLTVEAGDCDVGVIATGV